MSEAATGMKALVPRLRFPEFRNAPRWESKKLVDIAHVVRGGSPRPIADYLTEDEDGLAWLKIGDVSEGAKYIAKTSERIKRAGLSKTREIRPSDLILSNSMSFGRPYLSKVSACIHDGWLAITDLSEDVSSEFAYYLLTTDGCQRYFADAAAGSGVHNLNIDIVEVAPVAVPSKPEQIRVADCLSSLDDLITAHADKLAALKQHKHGLLEQLFPREGETVPRLRFPEFRNASQWERLTLSHLAVNLDNQRIPITERDRVGGEIPYYGASGVLDHVKDFIFDEDLLCVSEDGANLVARSTPIAFPISGKTWVNNHAHVLRFRVPSTQKIVEEYLNATPLDDYLTGMAQPKLNRAMLDTVTIPVSRSEAEQQRAAACLSTLDTLIAAESDKLAALKQHKQGLLQQLFPAMDEATA